MTVTTGIALAVAGYAVFWLGKNWSCRSSPDVEEQMLRNLGDRVAPEPRRSVPKPPPPKPYYLRQKFPFTSKGGLVVVTTSGLRVTYRGGVTIEDNAHEGVEIWVTQCRMCKGYPYFSSVLIETIAAKDFVRYEMPTGKV